MEIEIGERAMLLMSSAMVVIFKLVVITLGYKVIKLGYDLLLKGVKGEFKFSGSAGGAEANLQSASPGLLFILLGCVVISIAVIEKYPQEATKSEYKYPVSNDGIVLPELKDSDMELD
jgi:hypothetical protein